MKIVPAILAEKFDNFAARLKEAESFADYVQLDIMDGVFVKSRSFPIEDINSVKTPLSFEIHLMVEDPLPYVSRVDHPGLRKVIFHFEAVDDPRAVAAEIRERGLVPGIAIRPETGSKEFAEAALHADTLLFLTVDPCCYGSAFKPEVMRKVAEARTVFPDKVIGVDGGVALDNLRMFLDAGVDYACVGSRIFLEGNPKDNYQLFIRELHRLERA